MSAPRGVETRGGLAMGVAQILMFSGRVSNETHRIWQAYMVDPLPLMPADQCSAATTMSKDHRLVLVAYGYDNRYWASWQSAAGFLAWKSLAGCEFASGPALLQDARGDMLVFGRTATGQIEYATLRPNGGIAAGFTSLGGAMTGRPAPIVDARGLLHVFAQSATDRAVVYKEQHANTSHAIWGSWQLLDGAVSSAPQPMLDAEGWLHIFARGLDRSLWHKQQVPSVAPGTGHEWCAWAPLGPGLPLPSLPRVLRRLDAHNLVELFVRGPDRALWHKRQARPSENACSNLTSWPPTHPLRIYPLPLPHSL